MTQNTEHDQAAAKTESGGSDSRRLLAAEFDLEAVYDDQISPLMQQIIAICKEQQMPMVASFCFRKTEDGDDVANTCLPFGDRQPERLKFATTAVYGGYNAGQ